MQRPPDSSELGHQLIWLMTLALPIACIARTVVFEEVFREPREWCQKRSKTCRALWQRKFFYLFTCEYCFSHWVTFFFLWLTRFKLLLDDWRGYVIAAFALVVVANTYLNLYARLRLEIHREKETIKTLEQANEGADAREARPD